MEAVRKNDQGSFSTIHRFIFYSLPLRRTGKSCDDKTIDLLKVIGDEQEKEKDRNKTDPEEKRAIGEISKKMEVSAIAWEKQGNMGKVMLFRK